MNHLIKIILIKMIILALYSLLQLVKRKMKNNLLIYHNYNIMIINNIIQNFIKFLINLMLLLNNINLMMKILRISVSKVNNNYEMNYQEYINFIIFLLLILHINNMNKLMLLKILFIYHNILIKLLKNIIKKDLKFIKNNIKLLLMHKFN